MFSLRSHALLRAISALVLVFLSFGFTLAQDDPDPNSPTPVLISESGSTRALTYSVGSECEVSRLDPPQTYSCRSKVELFVTNIV